MWCIAEDFISRGAAYESLTGDWRLTVSFKVPNRFQVSKAKWLAVKSTLASAADGPGSGAASVPDGSTPPFRSASSRLSDAEMNFQTMRTAHVLRPPDIIRKFQSKNLQ